MKWQFQKEEVLDFLKKLKPVMKDGPDAYTRSVCLVPDLTANTCTIHVNTGEYRIRKKFPILNQIDQINRTFVMEFKSFFFTVSAVENEILTIDSDGTHPLITAHNGFVQLENFWRLEKKIVVDDLFFAMDESKCESFSPEEFTSVLKTASRVFVFCSESRLKKFAIINRAAYFNFLHSAAFIKNINIPDIVIRHQDIPFFLKMLGGEENLTLNTVGKHCVFKTSSMYFSFPRFRAEEVEFILKALERMKVQAEVEISYSLFRQLSTLVLGVIRGTGLVTFDNKNGHVFLNAKDRLGKNMEFPLAKCDRGLAFVANCSSDFFRNMSKIVVGECKQQEIESFRMGIDAFGSMHFMAGELSIIAGGTRK